MENEKYDIGKLVEINNREKKINSNIDEKKKKGNK